MTLKAFLSTNMAYFAILEQDGKVRIDPIVSGTNLIKIYSELIGDLSVVEGIVNKDKEFISEVSGLKVEITPLSKLNYKNKSTHTA